jgi:CRISPR-associated exonuclease Cas4
MYSEDDLLPLSGLQHLHFCERQWGLIHIEQQWEENRLTAEGRVLHERAHESGSESRPGVLVARGLYLQSLRLGLAGQADAVEFQEVGSTAPGAIQLPGRKGWWRPFPVEYKRGEPKADSCDEVQLCAQAMCLEEMFGAAIGSGALFYGRRRRRTEVRFAGELRAHTEELARRMHQLFSAGTTAAAYAKKCDRCSLYDRCMPRATSKRTTVERYLARALRDEDVDR